MANTLVSSDLAASGCAWVACSSIRPTGGSSAGPSCLAACAPILSACCSNAASSLVATPPTSLVAPTRPCACCTTWVSSCARSSWPLAVHGRYCPGAKKMSIPRVNARAPMSLACWPIWTRTSEKSMPKRASIFARTSSGNDSPLPVGSMSMCSSDLAFGKVCSMAFAWMNGVVAILGRKTPSLAAMLESLP